MKLCYENEDFLYSEDFHSTEYYINHRDTNIEIIYSDVPECDNIQVFMPPETYAKLRLSRIVQIFDKVGFHIKCAGCSKFLITYKLNLFTKKNLVRCEYQGSACRMRKIKGSIGARSQERIQDFAKGREGAGVVRLPKIFISLPKGRRMLF